MAASKPIPWPFGINTALISLNNNFGTLLTLVLGCFPLDIQPYRTMSDYSIFISSPSENKYSLIESSRPPNVRKKHFIHFPKFHFSKLTGKLSTSCMRSQFCTF